MTAALLVVNCRTVPKAEYMLQLFAQQLHAHANELQAAACAEVSRSAYCFCKTLVIQYCKQRPSEIAGV